MPRVVALVLNWCAEDDTLACVASLEAQEYPALEICLLDNASPDGSGARLAARRPDLHFIQTGANLGYAGGNNAGIAWALDRGAEYVLVINDDALLAPGALRELLSAMRAEPRAGMAAPTIEYRDAPGRTWWAGGRFSTLKAIGTHEGFGAPPSPPAPPREVNFVCGCAVLLRAEALRACGTFDAAFVSYLEDVDLSLRFAARGWRLLHVPAARALHAVPWPPEAPSPWAIEHRDRNRRRIAARHLSALRRAAFRAWFYPTRLLLTASALARADLPRARALWRGTWGNAS
ncbi:MAG: glycosyltransferase family 2 protein [Gemmatimonadaceae bacterium]